MSRNASPKFFKKRDMTRIEIRVCLKFLMFRYDWRKEEAIDYLRGLPQKSLVSLANKIDFLESEFALDKEWDYDRDSFNSNSEKKEEKKECNTSNSIAKE